MDGIVVIDAHGRVETFNPAAERLFGYGADEVLGHNVDMLMPSPYREEHDTYLSRYLATGRAKIIGVGREVQGRRKDGSTFPLHLSVGQITINGERRFTGILHDLSARVSLEERMREQAALAKIAFSDAGPGIPNDVRDKVFTPFFTTKSRGSGLGLPTAKRFVEAHNGQIAIDCPPAGGTTVVIRIPMSAS